jgi:hypothetical protein
MKPASHIKKNYINFKVLQTKYLSRDTIPLKPLLASTPVAKREERLRERKSKFQREQKGVNFFTFLDYALLDS